MFDVEELQRELEEDPGECPYWDPQEPGEMVSGILVDQRLIASDKGYAPYKRLVLKQADGSRISVACWHTVLKNEIEHRRPVVGDWLGIKYLGSKPNKSGGGSFFGYVVKHKPAHGPRYSVDGEPLVSDAELDEFAAEVA